MSEPRKYKVCYYQSDLKSGESVACSFCLLAYDAKDAHYQMDLMQKEISDPKYRVWAVMPDAPEGKSNSMLEVLRSIDDRLKSVIDGDSTIDVTVHG